MDDNILVAADADVRAGSIDFDSLFRAEYAPLVRALTIVAGSEAAADAVQDAFVQASRHWSRVSRLDRPGAWVRRAAINRLTNHRRGLLRRKRAVDRLAVVEPAHLAPPDLDLAAAIRRLPERQRLAVVLHYYADLPVAEVAEVLGVSAGTVKSNLHDARSNLRIELQVNHDD